MVSELKKYQKVIFRIVENSWEFLEIFTFRFRWIASKFFLESLFCLFLCGLPILGYGSFFGNLSLILRFNFHFIVELFNKGELELKDRLVIVFFRFFIEIVLLYCKSSSSRLHFIFIKYTLKIDLSSHHKQKYFYFSLRQILGEFF